MHIDWNWIKQRPHFLAEGLNEYCDITVLYQVVSNAGNWFIIQLMGLKSMDFYISI